MFSGAWAGAEAGSRKKNPGAALKQDGSETLVIPVVVSGKGQRGGETCSWYLELKNCKIKFRNRNRRILYFDRVGQTGLGGLCLRKLNSQFSY